jgi:hypothetical protein
MAQLVLATASGDGAKEGRLARQRGTPSRVSSISACLPVFGATGVCLIADRPPREALCHDYDVLGFAQTPGDEAFRQLVLARIIEPASKQDSP